MALTGRILITGSKGQLGRDLVVTFSPRCEVTGVDIEELDIRRRDAVLEAVRTIRPQILIHSAAYTDVDGCEDNRTLAFDVNAEGTRNLALACREVGAAMVYYSTDYVFRGDKDSPYTEEDLPDAKTVYGASKLAGERAASEILDELVILRIAWVYGYHGKNFVKTMLRLGREQAEASRAGRDVRPLKVVDDQVGNPTWTMEIVRQTETVLSHRLRGIFHATSEGEVSWYGFARKIFETVRMDVQVVPCTTAEYPRPAPRPARSSLENTRLKQVGANVMRPWADALADFITAFGKDLIE